MRGLSAAQRVFTVPSAHPGRPGKDEEAHLVPPLILVLHEHEEPASYFLSLLVTQSDIIVYLNDEILSPESKFLYLHHLHLLPSPTLTFPAKISSLNSTDLSPKG